MNSPPLGKGGAGGVSEPKRMGGARAFRKWAAAAIPLGHVKSCSDPPNPPLPRGGGKRIPCLKGEVPMFDDNPHYFRTFKTNPQCLTTAISLTQSRHHGSSHWRSRFWRIRSRTRNTVRSEQRSCVEISAFSVPCRWSAKMPRSRSPSERLSSPRISVSITA